MNCANHADASAVAYCRTCGKALCANCTRPVRGVIYCEDCLGTRMEGVPMPSGAPAAGFMPGTASSVPPLGTVPPGLPPRPIPMPVSSGPNPTVAGILAGVFPFGVGAVYTGQYAKGLAHLAIFVLLIAGCNVNGSEALPIICGFGIAFFVVYQIFDAVRSARALQAGLPPPDPYGLAATFGVHVSVGNPTGGNATGASPNKADSASRIPTSAIILILLGALFLLHTAGLFENGFDKFWPVLLMALGAWLFARNYGLFGNTGIVDPRTCNRKLVGPAMIFVIGTLCLLDTTNIAGFHRTWPVILLFVGLAKLLQGTGSGTTTAAYPPDGFAPPPVPPAPFPPPSVTPPPAASSDAKSTEVNNG